MQNPLELQHKWSFKGYIIKPAFWDSVYGDLALFGILLVAKLAMNSSFFMRYLIINCVQC